MNQKANAYWQKIETSRLDLFERLDKIDPSVLRRQPAPDKWSVNQVMLHLIDAESASLRYLQKKLSFGTDKLAQSGLKAWFQRNLMRIIFKLPIKFKAPAHLAKSPETVDYAEVKSRWVKLRQDFEAFLNTQADPVFSAELWKHQIVGKMNLYQMLDFFDDHLDRHRGQIERTIKLVSH